MEIRTFEFIGTDERLPIRLNRQDLTLEWLPVYLHPDDVPHVWALDVGGTFLDKEGYIWTRVK